MYTIYFKYLSANDAGEKLSSTIHFQSRLFATHDLLLKAESWSLNFKILKLNNLRCNLWLMGGSKLSIEAWI